MKVSIEALNVKEVERLIELMFEAKDKEIFTFGMGRSGFIARAFALHLMNLGFNVYFLGETIMPVAEKDDILIAISGAGSTKVVLTVSAAAKEIGANVASITSFPESAPRQQADWH